VRRCWRSGDSTSKRVLAVLEFCYLRLWKIIVQWVAIVKFRINDINGDGTGSFEVKIKTKTAKFTNMIIARFRESRYLVRKSEVLVENTRNSSGDEIVNVNFLYDDIVGLHVLQNTLDSCINSATDRRGYVYV